jgi:hypothetical protein
MITEAEIGDVLKPLKNVSILKTTPKKAAAIILGNQLGLFFLWHKQ